MKFQQLSSSDRESVLQCMKFIASSHSVDDWEFRTRLGISRETLKQIISSYPAIDDSENSEGYLAINNCLNEVCYGLVIPPEEWPMWFSLPMTDMRETYRNWLEHHSQPRSASVVPGMGNDRRKADDPMRIGVLSERSESKELSSDSPLAVLSTR